MTDALSAVEKALKSDRENTLTVSISGTMRVSRERGIKPLLMLAESGEDLRGAVAADRIVGKAAALLYAVMGFSEVFAQTLSKTGKAILAENGIAYSYDTLTDAIINRAGTGLCPMEQAVREIDDPREAAAAIKRKINELKHQ